MFKLPPTPAPVFSDAELVAQTLAGSREAFAEIVTRYQTLVCSIAYSATGSLTQSEDLAQETFLTAWQRLRDLREPGSLRSWLCGIARHLQLRAHRDSRREPAHAAEPLDAVREAAAPDAPAPAQAISREEEAILWRALERIPGTYREPLVLLYREHHTIEQVAAQLEISEEAARQRLSRGRKLLEAEVTAFVEGALRQSAPNAAFCASVMAALPAAGFGLRGAAVGAAGAAKSGGFAAAVALPLAGFFASLFGSVGLVRLAATPRVRRFTVRSLLGLWLTTVALWLALIATQLLRTRAPWIEAHFGLVQTAIYLGWSAVTTMLVIRMGCGFLALHREITPAGTPHRAVPPTRSAALVASVMTAGSLAWLVQLTGAAHDFAALALTLATGGAVIAWIFLSPACVRRTGRDPVAFAWVPAVAIAGVSLALLNLRLDRWLAVLRGTDLAGAHRFLPMSLVHGATALWIAWVVAVALFFRSRRSSAPSVSSP